MTDAKVSPIFIDPLVMSDRLVGQLREDEFPSENRQRGWALGPWATNIKFHGFDGNNESEKMGIANFLVKKMDRFPRFKGRDLNAHSPTFERQRRMLRLFEPMREKLIGVKLSLAQLVDLLKV